MSYEAVIPGGSVDQCKCSASYPNYTFCRRSGRLCGRAAGRQALQLSTVAHLFASQQAFGGQRHTMFSREVAVICRVGMSQARRQILAKGLVANHATVLDFSPEDVNGPSLASSLIQQAGDMFAGAPKGSSKRKRASSGAGDGASSGKRKATEHGPVALGPTMVVCDAASFSSARASEEMEGIFNKYPLKEEASSVKVVGSAWLSECLRVGSAQPMGSHLLDTITPATAKKFSNKCPTAAVSGAAGAGAGAGGSGGASKSSSSSSWGCLARPAPSKAKAAGNDGGGGSSLTAGGGGTIGAGSGGSDGPGVLSKEPVWRDGGGDVGSSSEGGRWEELMEGSVLRWVPDRSRVSTHIVAFDMDGTLIKTKSGKRFGDAADDWQLWNGKIPTVLRKWHDRGYKVAIISNQMGVGTGKVDPRMLKAKVRSVVKALGIPVEAYLACRDDYYRKPRPGCWEMVSTSYNGGLDVEKAACLYVGDAAGRPKQGTHKKDFSAGDLKLALNAKIPFQTPEQFFMRSTTPIHKNRSLAMLGFDPSTLLGKGSGGSAESLSRREGDGGGGLEMVVLVGPPGGGKSTLCKDKLPDHARINQDELKSLKRCEREAGERLRGGRSVVIDATNAGRGTRAGWLDLARQHGATARCIYLTTPKEACFHLNAFRGCNPWSPEGERRKVPDVVIHTWFKYVDPPHKNEGFSEIVHVPFRMRDLPHPPQGVEGRSERDLLLMYLVPK
ncbi:unnamed protein product [Ectocarpus sp. CCAP 1310/34]|nr:unnamed protein product [Ectocarpus sp. CCAP 1310/34]